jgi:hypothetical protein
MGGRCHRAARHIQGFQPMDIPNNMRLTNTGLAWRMGPMESTTGRSDNVVNSGDAQQGNNPSDGTRRLSGGRNNRLTSQPGA